MEKQMNLLIIANLILIVAVLVYFAFNIIQTQQVIEYMRLGNELMGRLL